MSQKKIKYLRLNGEAVRSILDGEKTQLRFALKNQDIIGGTMTESGFLTGIPEYPDYGGKVIKPQYGAGSIVAVRETWARDPFGNGYIYPSEIDGASQKWEPSTRMPNEAVRIYLLVTNVHVERLQDITLEDIEREGIWTSGTLFPREDFARRYNRSLSKEKREMYSWDKNPFVWVVAFERCEKPEV